MHLKNNVKTCDFNMWKNCEKCGFLKSGKCGECENEENTCLIKLCLFSNVFNSVGLLPYTIEN